MIEKAKTTGVFALFTMKKPQVFVLMKLTNFLSVLDVVKVVMLSHLFESLKVLTSCKQLKFLQKTLEWKCQNLKTTWS